MSSRGINRGVFSSLVDDPDFQRLPSDARLTLLTARICKQAGPACIFRFYPEMLALQTGLPRRRVDAALMTLQAERWVEVESGVLWIRNGLRYDPNMRLANPKHLKAVQRALAELPRVEMVLKFCDYYQIAKPFDSPSNGGAELALPNTRIPEYPNPPSPPGSPRCPARGAPSSPPATQPPLESFERFWAEYPRHIGKPAALKAWLACPRAPKPSLRHDPPSRVPDAVLAGLSRWRAYWVRQQTPDDRIPYPATWLNDRRWEAELVVTASNPYAHFPTEPPGA